MDFTTYPRQVQVSFKQILQIYCKINGDGLPFNSSWSSPVRPMIVARSFKVDITVQNTNITCIPSLFMRGCRPRAARQGYHIPGHLEMKYQLCVYTGWKPAFECEPNCVRHITTYIIVFKSFIRGKLPLNFLRESWDIITQQANFSHSYIVDL